jgi:hypothetical protein
MIVQANDGLYYRKPMWYGVLEDRRWLVNFNSVGELELSIEVDKKTTSCIGKRARKILEAWKVRFKIGVFDTVGIFPPDWESVLRYKYVLDLLAAPPTPSQTEQIVQDVSLMELKYCFNVEFPISDVWQYFEKKPTRLSGDLCDYLVGGFNSPFTNQAKVKKCLQKLFPDMIRLNLLEATAKYGQRVRVPKHGQANWRRKNQRTEPKSENSTNERQSETAS